MSEPKKRGKSGVYYIRYELPPGPDGKRRQRRVACPGLNKQEARDHLAEIRAQIRRGTYIDPDSATVGTFLAEWLKGAAAGSVRPNTLETNQRACDDHIIPALGRIAMGKLTPMHIQEFVNNLTTKGRIHRREGEPAGLAPKTVRNIHMVLHAALRQAVAWRLIPYNPADGVTLPRRRRTDKRAASVGDVAALLPLLEASKHRVPFLILLETGLRRSEVLGLRWEDVSLESSQLWVRKSVGYAKATGVYLEDTKTAAGERPVLVSSELVGLLREHRRCQVTLASDSESGFTDQGLVCPNPTGGLMMPKVLTRAFSVITEKAKVDLDLHELRHTQISQLGNMGIYDPVTRDRVGHEDASVTRMYTHTTVEMQRPAVEVMTNFIAAARALAQTSKTG